MTTIPELAQTLQDVLTIAAETAAVASGVVRRRSKLSGALFVQTLVFGWMGTPSAGIQLLSRMAGVLGVSISPQGSDQRCSQQAAARWQRRSSG